MTDTTDEVEVVDLPPITDRGLAGQILDAAWPEFGGDQVGGYEFWEIFSKAVHFTLRCLPEQKHTDRSIPCPKCGFFVRRVERRPFVIEDEDHD